MVPGIGLLKVVSYPHNACDTVAPVGTSYQASHWCSPQASQLGMTDGFLSPLVARLATSSTMKSSQEEGASRAALA